MYLAELLGSPSLRLIFAFVSPSRRCAAASRILRARSTAMAGLASETGMGVSYKFPLCPQYRIHVQDTEQTLATILGLRVSMDRRRCTHVQPCERSANTEQV